jgi:transposase
MIIGCDYHPGFQQITLVDSETGELQERRLEHREDAEKFYRELAVRGTSVRLGMEASGHARWLERLFSELGFELWIGDAPAILGCYLSAATASARCSMRALGGIPYFE